MFKGIQFKVIEALTKDVGRGIARIDPADMKSIAVKVGDIVMIQGKQASVARVMPAYPDCRGRQVIQIDGMIRENAGVAVGEKVFVSRTEARVARQVVLLPLGGRMAVNIDYIMRSVESLPFRQGDKVKVSLLGLKYQEYTVVNTVPDGVVLVDRNTELLIEENVGKNPIEHHMAVRYEDIGGLQKQLHRIREMIELPLAYPSVFNHLGIDPPRGVLLCGPPGTGKTLIARAVASETKAHFIHVNGPEIIQKYYGESEAKLRELFEAAASKEPSIIFLDELDAIAPKRQNVTGEVEKRVVAQLLSLMDGLGDRGRVIVVGATNMPDTLDSALRRPGRFDREITIGVPDRAGRLEILHIHSRGMPLAGDVNLDRLAEVTNGFVGADLKAVCREAAMHALRKYIPGLANKSGDFTVKWINLLKVGMEDFLSALKEVEPSATRELMVEVPRVGWGDVGGCKEIKLQLRKAIEWPFKYERLFRDVGLDMPRGILLHGSPGTGKTMLVKAVANEINANFISIKGPALLSKWVGESERALREVFKRARQVAPCIIFFDEIDALVPHRGMGGQVAERMLSQLLTEMDGVEELQRVVVLAATNRIDMIDPALLRPGRFDLILHLDLPVMEDRMEILAVHMRNLPLTKDVDDHELALKTAGFSGADLKNLCRRATLLAIGEYVESIDEPAEKKVLSIGSGHFNLALRELTKKNSSPGGKDEPIGEG